MSTATKTLASKLSYLASHRGSDAATVQYVADANRRLSEGDMAMARVYLASAVKAWESSTGYTLRRGELAGFAVSA